MRNLDEEPRSGSMLRYMTVMFIAVSAKIDVITADLICVGLTAYVVWKDHTENRK
ncbi:hypothetical protein JS533_001490 [Bifidobacterium amazonense]|uniref:Holin n=1 Tax=Bifidobacterium amazonense TaxID=2809027 RepID=A0ABS9VS96_9BIFI|nr:hypothetical protein [Bifidobacterium amazonense]MCH9274962.1 hypothetical protein [Bifidobacterium amazonense]